MEKAAYINSVSAYLPNSPIANEDMEDYIGKIGGNPSRVRSIVLRQNGIKTRYYGLNKNQSLTHSNAELAKEAVCGLFENENIPDDLTLLACGTSTPDQLLPSHASMVHGELANYPMEIFSSAGVCLTSLQALKICYSNLIRKYVLSANCFEDEKCKDCEFIPICMGGCAFYRIKNMFDNGNFDICSLYKDNGVIEKCICLHLDKLRIKTPSI